MTKTVELGLAFATVVPVKARPSIDSQYLSSNGRLDILVGKTRQGCLSAMGIHRSQFPAT